MKKRNLFTSCVIVATFGLGIAAYAEEPTAMEKLETSKNKTVDGAKKGMRAAKDETCEMMNGKMHCAGKKMKHKMQNATDKAGTDATEIKNEHN